jgi:ATP phosphoribosyltransferase
MIVFTIVYGYDSDNPMWSKVVLCSTEYPHMTDSEFRQMGLDRVQYVRSTGGMELYYTVGDAIPVKIGKSLPTG